MQNVTRSLRTYGPRFALVVLVWAVMAAWIPEFRGTASVYAVLENLPLLGLVGLGLMVTMIAGELDLSVASVAAIGGVVAVQASDAGLVISLLAGTAAGAAVGIIQGYLIGRLGITSLAFTIGSLVVLRGLAFVLAGNGPIAVDNLTATDPLLERYWIFSVASVVAIVVIVALGLFLAYVRFGRDLYAIGGGRNEAVAMGVPVRRSVVLAFAISGTCAALAGALVSMKGGTADPNGFQAVLVYGIAAALLGGVGLYGGRGTVVHVVLGVVTLGVLQAALNARGTLPATTDIVTGVVLLLVVAAAVVGGRVTRAAAQRRASVVT